MIWVFNGRDELLPFKTFLVNSKRSNGKKSLSSFQLLPVVFVCELEHSEAKNLLIIRKTYNNLCVMFVLSK